MRRQFGLASMWNGTNGFFFVVTSLMMAACVSVSGIIGFVGLVSPHIVRLIFGPVHRRLLPMSFVLGGIVLCICDTIAKSVMAAEIPVGIITAIVGAPFFIYLFARKAYGGDVMSGEILKFEHVTVGYDARDVVRDFSSGIRQGEFVSLIGPNGAENPP